MNNVWDIITYYYSDISRIVSLIKLSENYFVNKELQNDMVQDIVLALSGNTFDKLKKLHLENKMCHYITGTAKRMAFASNSDFNRKIMKYEKCKTKIDRISIGEI